MSEAKSWEEGRREVSGGESRGSSCLFLSGRFARGDRMKRDRNEIQAENWEQPLSEKDLFHFQNLTLSCSRLILRRKKNASLVRSWGYD